MSVALKVENLFRSYGGIRAVDNVSFATKPGAITGVIGPNGAGKTSLFNLISGTVKPSSGRVLLDGQVITGQSAAAIARRGLVRTFQMAMMFPENTVYENIYRSALFRQFSHPLSLLNPAALSLGRSTAHEHAQAALDLVALGDLMSCQAGSLPYGQQKVLGVGMALAAQPRMLLMDEPAAGLNPTETIVLADLIRRVHATGIDIVLVEHDMQMVMRLCENIVVLMNGKLLASGPAEDIRANKQVIEAYLGADIENA